MRLQNVMLVFVGVAVVSACAGVKYKAMEINPGDSKARVMQTLGTPDDRQFEGQQEALQYGRVVSIGVCDYTVVWLRDGKTTGITSYRNFSTLGCRHDLQAVNWEEAPDRAIEIRRR